MAVEQKYLGGFLSVRVDRVDEVKDGVSTFMGYRISQNFRPLPEAGASESNVVIRPEDIPLVIAVIEADQKDHARRNLYKLAVHEIRRKHGGGELE